MAGCGDLPQDVGVPHGVLADGEEDAGGAFVGQRLQHGRGVHRPWAVVEGQHDFLVGQEIQLLEMLEAESRPAGGVDFDHPADAERIGIGAGAFGRRWRGFWLGSRHRAGHVGESVCLRGKLRCRSSGAAGAGAFSAA